jgi:RNA polymerase-binding transcription factor DksA
MTAQERQRIEALLDARLEELVRMRTAMRRAVEGMRESELAHIDNHPADADLHEQEVDETTRLFLDEEERRIAEARRALSDGTYGICLDCLKPIPAERLSAMPAAVRCVDCQRHFEGSHRQRIL